MKPSTYMDRALRARDPRFARVLGKLGYARSDMQAEHAEPADDVAGLRAEYKAVVGRNPFYGWDAAALREKIAAAKEGN